MAKRFSTLLLFFCFAAASAFAQTRTVTVLNKKDNLPVIGAVATFIRSSDNDEKKQRQSTLTDEQGIAEIPFDGVVIVKVSNLGFTETSDTVQAGASATILLQPNDVSIDQVVVTAQYTPDDPRNSVYSVTVIPQEKIERQGATNLRDVLAQESNIRLTQDPVLGANLTMQGLTGEQVKIMIDGVPVIGRMNGNVDVSQINLNTTQRIEIIEGPMSVQYGTNALAGVINLITDYKKLQGINARVNGFYESAGTFNADAGVGYGKKGHYIDLSGGRYFFDGYSQKDTSRVMQWRPKEQYFGMLKYGYSFKRLQFTAKGDAFYEKITNRGPADKPYMVTAFDDFYHTHRYNGSASLRGEILKNHYIDQIVAYNHFKRIKNRFFKNLTTLELTLTENDGDQDTTRFDAYLARGFISRNKTNKIFNYQFGYEINVETGEGGRIEGVKSIGDYAAFMSYNIKPVRSLALQAAVRWSYNSQYAAPVTPTFNLRWRPIEQLVVRFSYGRGFRAPSLKEQYLDFVDINHDIHGNPDLKAEYSHNISASLDYVRKMNEHRVRLVPSFYFNHIKNGINLVQGATAIEYVYANIEKFQTLGGELNAGYQFKELKIDVGTGLIGRKNFITNQFKYSADLSVQVSYEIPKANILVSVFNKFNGKRVSFGMDEIGDISESRMDAYNLLDVSLNRRFWKDRISLTAGIKNLLNVNTVNTLGSTGIHSADTGSLIAWGRTFFASLKFAFSK